MLRILNLWQHVSLVAIIIPIECFRLQPLHNRRPPTRKISIPTRPTSGQAPTWLPDCGSSTIRRIRLFYSKSPSGKMFSNLLKVLNPVKERFRQENNSTYLWRERMMIGLSWIRLMWHIRQRDRTAQAKTGDGYRGISELAVIALTWCLGTIILQQFPLKTIKNESTINPGGEAKFIASGSAKPPDLPDHICLSDL